MLTTNCIGFIQQCKIDYIT